MQIINHRNGLQSLKNAVANQDHIRIGYIGGSITEESVKHNWPEYVSMWIKDKFPLKRVYAENMGIGGTGSDMAVFRFDWEMADKDCDLIFVEFAVNDDDKESAFRMRTREGLVRKILGRTKADIVFVYTYIQGMYDDMISGNVPESIAEFEQLADHYGIGSVWMARRAFDMMERGMISFEEWLPDGLHPASTGSRIYAAAVTDYLEEELTADTPALRRGTEPLDPLNWESARVLPFEEVDTHGLWVIKSMYNRDVRHALHTSSVTASLSFTCRCRAIVLCRLFGTRCGVLKYRINGGEWKSDTFPVADWMGGAEWPYQITLADGGEEQEYFVEVKGEKVTREGGSSLFITHIGIV